MTSDYRTKYLLLHMTLAIVITVASLPSKSFAQPISPPHSVDQSLAKTDYQAEYDSHRITEMQILIDDFAQQPRAGEAFYPHNRLGGTRGTLNNSVVSQQERSLVVSIASGQAWGGLWMSLNHPIEESLPLNFNTVLPPQIAANYQSAIQGLLLQLEAASPDTRLKIELKNAAGLVWVSEEVELDVGQQLHEFDLTNHLDRLSDITELAVVISGTPDTNRTVTLERLYATTTTSIIDTATAAFVWSYAMLLNNWNESTGLVRDKARDSSGTFDAIQATGALASATALAEQLGVVSREDAVWIVETIGDALLNTIPTYRGLWPHWVELDSSDVFVIANNTEWSLIDTTIAAIGLRTAQLALGIDSTETEQILRNIDWTDLTLPTGLSHGYAYDKTLLPYAWEHFGGESWLIALAYAASNQTVPPIALVEPPTFNGSGFIDELAWLFLPPPTIVDYWGNDWINYAQTAALEQYSYFEGNYPDSCIRQNSLFGLSAAEIPEPAMVDNGTVYRAFGVGGHVTPNDGERSPNENEISLGAPVVVPHYSGLIARLDESRATEVWTWLIDNHLYSPLNNVESLMFPARAECNPKGVIFNGLKGSWNLALQTLGWGNHLALRDHGDSILWSAFRNDPFLYGGYRVLVPTLGPVSIPALDVAVSSELPGWPGSRLIDGEPGPAWSSYGNVGHLGESEWAAVVLPERCPVSRVRIRPRGNSKDPGSTLGFPKDWVLQYSYNSADGSHTCDTTNPIFEDLRNWLPIKSLNGYPQPPNDWLTIDFPPVNAQCIRLLGVELSQDDYGYRYLQIGEIEAYCNAEPESITGVAVSSELDGWPKERLIDGEPGPAWSSNGRGRHLAESEWASVLLGDLRTVDRIRLRPRGSSEEPATTLGFPKDFVLQYSYNSDNGIYTCNPSDPFYEDLRNWLPLLSYSGYPQPANDWLVFDISPIQAGCVRLLGVELSQDNYGYRYFQLGEFELYNQGEQLSPSGAAVSSELPDWPGDRIIDGAPGPAWSSVGNSGHLSESEWASVILEERQTVNWIRVRPRGNSNDPDWTLGFPKDFVVQYAYDSVDGTHTCNPEDSFYADIRNWLPLLSVNGYPQPPNEWLAFDFDPVEFQCVRILGVELSQDDYGARYFQLGEFELYGSD